jgi:O-antigen ligase
MAFVCAAIIALMPFHAFLTVWLSSGLGHYTALRLWKEALLLLLLVGFAALFVTRPKLRRAARRELLVPLILVYALFVAVAGAIAYDLGGATAKAFAYGVLLDTRYLAFFGITWAITQFDDLLVRLWQRLLFIPAAIVAVIAVLQYVLLPADFLRHFGYGPQTIPASATIDQQAAYPRVQSTLRGPNPLGTYMILVASALGVLLVRVGKITWQRALLYVFSVLALVMSFSRSAWLGALLSTLLIIWLAVSSVQLRRYLALAAAVLIVVAGLTGYGLRNNNRFQNVFLHTSNASHSSESSNHGHVAALEQGAKDIIRTPWGNGTGTAGPASVYNDGHVRIAENYYVQIAQEIGLIGLLLLGAITVLVAMRLWRRRAHPLAGALFVSLIGITLVNMLMHAWADDTLAYIWWGLAGAAAALPVRKNYETAK